MELEDGLRAMAEKCVEGAIAEGTEATLELINLLGDWAEKHLAKLKASLN